MTQPKRNHEINPNDDFVSRDNKKRAICALEPTGSLTPEKREKTRIFFLYLSHRSLKVLMTMTFFLLDKDDDDETISLKYYHSQY